MTVPSTLADSASAEQVNLAAGVDDVICISFQMKSGFGGGSIFIMSRSCDK